MDYLGNIQLECEYISSLLISGSEIPSKYSNLRLLFSDLPMVDFGITSETLLVLKKKLVDKFGLLKDKEIEKFCKGDSIEVLGLLMQIVTESEVMLPIFKVAQEESKELHYDETYQKVSQETDIDNMIGVINATPIDPPSLGDLKMDHLNLQVLISKANLIIRNYGTCLIKPKIKQYEFSKPEDFRLFLYLLENSLKTSNLDPMIVVTLSQLIGTLDSLIPLVDAVDPYRNDILYNTYKIFSNPKDYYSYCKHEDIVSSVEGNLFYTIYPEFFKKFVDMYLEDFDKMDYQEQINFRKCFDLQENVGELVSLVSASLQSQPAQQT